MSVHRRQYRCQALSMIKGAHAPPARPASKASARVVTRKKGARAATIKDELRAILQGADMVFVMPVWRRTGQRRIAHLAEWPASWTRDGSGRHQQFRFEGRRRAAWQTEGLETRGNVDTLIAIETTAF